MKNHLKKSITLFLAQVSDSYLQDVILQPSRPIKQAVPLGQKLSMAKK